MFWPAMCFWRAIMLRLCWRHLLKGWNIAKSWRIWWCAKCWKTVLWAGAIICQLLSMEFYNWGNAKCWLCNIQAHMVQMQALYWDGVLGAFCIWDNVIVSWNMWLKALWTWKSQCIAGNKMIILFDQFKTWNSGTLTFPPPYCKIMFSFPIIISKVSIHVISKVFLLMGFELSFRNDLGPIPMDISSSRVWKPKWHQIISIEGIFLNGPAKRKILYLHHKVQFSVGYKAICWR